MSSSIIPGYAGPYTLPSNPKENTLAIYLNGQMINNECVIASNTFTLPSDLADILIVSSSLFAIYVEDT